MMFSTKCTEVSGTGSEESELFAGGGEEMGKEGVGSDEVASAVAAVSDEIGDILKEELGDADRADRIGAELADLSAELGLLAGLADADTQPEFVSRFEVPFEWIAMAHRGSISGSSTSSSWSGPRGGRAKRPVRPKRTARRRPIAKSREVKGAGRRAIAARVVSVSEGSDVAAETDSTDQWTELDDQTAGSSDSSSVKEAAGVDVEFNGFPNKDQPEPPALAQFLLPLLTGETTGNEPDHFLIRHEDILQLLAVAEETAQANPEASPERESEVSVCLEEELALLHYVCESERLTRENRYDVFTPVEEWLLGVYHSWTEIYAAAGETGVEGTAVMACRCRACVSLACGAAALQGVLARVLAKLVQENVGVDVSVALVRSLRGGVAQHLAWQLAPLRALPPHHRARGEAIIHEELVKLAAGNAISNEIVTKVCVCRPIDLPMEKEYAVERLIRILEIFKEASTITYQVSGKSLMVSTAQRLEDMRHKTTQKDLSPWMGYTHTCHCLAPRTICSQQRNHLLRYSFFGMMQAANEYSGSKSSNGDTDKAVKELENYTTQFYEDNNYVEDKPPDTKSETEAGPHDNSGTWSSSSSLQQSGSSADGAGSSADETAANKDTHDLCRTVRHLMKSIASIERLMDRVLKHCDQWPNLSSDTETRQRVDNGLSEVDRKLMAMYKKLPDVQRRQLQVYKKQRKLTTVCRCVGLAAPPCPPAPLPPPPPPAACQPTRFTEVRRKVMHMRDQQLYYHRLRMWLEDQLRHESEILQGANVTLVDDLPKRKRCDPKVTRISTASKRKLKPVTPSLTKPFKILQMLKSKSLPQMEIKEVTNDDESFDSEAEPPEAFPLTKDDNLSDTDTIVGEKDADICKEMKECLAKFASFALNAEEDNENEIKDIEKYPDSVSPPLQEMSPTSSEPMPVYTPNPNQRLLTVNKFLNRNVDLKADKIIDFHSQITDINVPLNARRTPILVKDDKAILETDKPDVIVDTSKDPNMYKYVTFGLEIKKAMEECQSIINSYNNGVKDDDQSSNESTDDSNLTLDQICEIMINLGIQAEFLEKIDNESMNKNNTKIAELVENMPQILANMPEIASKLSELGNASFELPEFASIITNLPENETQLTPETLKQIRELKINKYRDNVKVTKNTAKRKIKPRTKTNIDNDVLNTMTKEMNKELSFLLKDDKEDSDRSNNKEELKDLLCSTSAQVVINKIFEYVEQNKSPELAKCLEEEKEILCRLKANPEMSSKAALLFEDSLKDALSIEELKQLFKSRFDSWKHYVVGKFKTFKCIPIELLDKEIEAMLEKFYSYIRDQASKQCVYDTDKIIEKIDEFKKNKHFKVLEEDCDGKEFVSKLLSTSAGNAFDLLIMKMSEMPHDKKSSVKSLKFKYIDVMKRCSESQELAAWILLDPEVAATDIQDLTDLPIRKTDATPDFTKMSNETKKMYFIERLREMNRLYMKTIPKNVLSGNEWLIMLYTLEQLEEKLKNSFNKVSPSTNLTVNTSTASEAEIVAAKGLSKIIGQASSRPVIKPNDVKLKAEEKDTTNETTISTNESELDKSEKLIAKTGDKKLMESFKAVKAYLVEGSPVPDPHKKHVLNLCSNFDGKLLNEYLELTLKNYMDDHTEKEKNIPVVGSQNPELLAKYSAQALRNAKQTLNAVAFKNIVRNGQSKSESDACDIPRTECNWTNDCMCKSCKYTEAVCLGDIVEHCFNVETKNKNNLEEKKKECKPPPKVVKQAKPQVKPCENSAHQQHICKVGHMTGGGCAGDAAPDQPCSCCYCTVFGHAPPMTTPVPRNFNETRERLRSILNKKKQKCIPANGDPEPTQETQPKLTPPVPQPKPPALPKTLPPCLSAQSQQKQLAEKMAKMTVSDKPAETKPKVLQRTVPVQVNVPPALKTEGKVNPQAMEQIRLQQAKQQAQAQLQLQQQQAQQQALQAQQQALQQQQHAQQQQQQHQIKKPEPIYDLPIHNKPTLTPQQQQLIRQQQQQLHQQQLQQQQLQQQQQQKLQQQQLQQQQLQQQQLQQQQQRQNKPQARDVSVSSRDTSVFSTSSGCEGDPSWRGSREDPRDLDALLQYIEGPTRHVDKGKKKAKKMRQKAKKLEGKLVEELQEVTYELNGARQALGEMQSAHNQLKRSVDEVKKTLNQQTKIKKKGKKLKLNGAQMAKNQQIAEQLGEMNTILNASAKEVHQTEKKVAELSRRLQSCERELHEVRTTKGKEDEKDQKELLRQKHLQQQQIQQQQLQQHQQQLQQQQLQQQQLQQQQLQQLRQQQLQQEQLRQQQLKQQQLQQLENERQKQAAILKATSASGVVRLRRMPGDGAVTLTAITHHPNSARPTAVNVQPQKNEQTQSDKQKKQTWEQALAHINQLAKGNKEKKQKEKKPERKPKEQPKCVPEESLPSTKKQRRQLAKQQADEEERRKQEALEAKSKKEKKKQESRREKEKVQEVKKEETKKEKKGKENKQEKNVQQTKQPKQTQQQPKKEKKEPAPKMEVKMPPCNSDAGKPSCSIMEQLSCGIQVADLKLPPGITLTRVQPCEKKEPPQIKSVPMWRGAQLAAPPTPLARPPPVIDAHPAITMFSTPAPESPPKPTPIPEPPAPKSKKAKKKAKKAAAAAETEENQDGTKMVTLRNPMFHPNLPPVQVNTQAPKKPEIRIPDPIPMPPNACQATITPTSNGMYTIRNPLMSLMHQQSLVSTRNPTPPLNPYAQQQQYNYVNPNTYTQQAYVIDGANNSKDEFQNRIMNLASFTQKNEDGYSLFKTDSDKDQRGFLSQDYYDQPKPTVSPNPIGTRPTENRFESESLFANPIQKPEPIGTPLKRDDRSDYSNLYTPFGQEDNNVFRNALFNDRNESNMRPEDQYMNGDGLPYFQRLRVGSKLNNEVTIHHVTESKFYKVQDPSEMNQDSMFGQSRNTWGEHYQLPTNTDSNVFLPVPERNLSVPLDQSDRDVDSYKRFDNFDMSFPPPNQPTVQLEMRDIAASMRNNHQ